MFQNYRQPRTGKVRGQRKKSILEIEIKRQHQNIRECFCLNVFKIQNCEL
jgi:hypothetical protein